MAPCVIVRAVSEANPAAQSKGAQWAAAYLAIALLPLPIALWRRADAEAGRGFWIEFGVALGFVGLAMMVLQFALTARFRWIGRGLGLDDMMQVHRQAGILAVVFVLAHPLILFVAHRPFLSFLDPRENAPRALALTTVTAAALLLVILPLARRRLRLSYEWWRLTHASLGALALLIGIAHVLMVGNYVSGLVKPAMWIAMTGGALLLLAHTRIVRPVAMRRRPWRVSEVRSEAPRLWTLALDADGHEGMSFHPGQFAWLSLEPSPLTLQQHPFTIASSAEKPARIELTIKELGDFTGRIGQVQPGTPAYLEGPYGNFSPDATQADALVFVVGGVGITPAMSALRTLRDRGDRRRIILVYGSDTREKAAFRDELERLEDALDLQVRLVLDHPPAGWKGARGPISSELLAEATAAAGDGQTHHFVCGPDPMMDGVETALISNGVPPARIHTERFNLV